MKIIAILILAVLLVGALSPMVRAAETGTFTYAKLVQIVERLVSFILKVAALAVVITIVYFGVRMVMAGSDTGAYAEARKGLNWALIGALVIFGAYTIIATVKGAVESLK